MYTIALFCITSPQYISNQTIKTVLPDYFSINLNLLEEHPETCWLERCYKPITFPLPVNIMYEQIFFCGSYLTGEWSILTQNTAVNNEQQRVKMSHYLWRWSSMYRFDSNVWESKYEIISTVDLLCFGINKFVCQRNPFYFSPNVTCVKSFLPMNRIFQFQGM